MILLKVGLSIVWGGASNRQWSASPPPPSSNFHFRTHNSSKRPPVVCKPNVQAPGMVCELNLRTLGTSALSQLPVASLPVYLNITNLLPKEIL